MSTLDDRLRAELGHIAAAQGYRRRRVVQVIDTTEPMRVSVDGRECLNFCSNDYLGLSTHAEITAALRAAAAQGVGSGAAHLVSGHSPQHHALEEELAAFVGRPRALLFSTGYMANFALGSALIHKTDAVFEDRLNHASLLDAGLISGARFSRYLHNDVDNLRSKLGKVTATQRWVLTDAVFSMDGDCAPLRELAMVCTQRGAHLMVDDAHGFGVLGAQGRGSLNATKLEHEQVPVYMATLGKAVGVAGAFIAGSEALIETLIQKARSYIYTTAMPPPLAAATRAALQVLKRDEWRREQLQRLIARFRQGAQQLGLRLLPSASAIQPIILGTAESAMAASEWLLQRGLLVTAIRPPTVPQGSARLRITLSAAHREAQVDQLLDALAQLPQLARLDKARV